MTDTINETRALLARWAAVDPLVRPRRLVDVVSALVADLEAARAELAAARAAMPTAEECDAMHNVASGRERLRHEVDRVLMLVERLDAYHAAHPAASPAAEVAAAFGAAPDLPEPCAVCSEALCECGTGRAGGGGHE